MSVKAFVVLLLEALGISTVLAAFTLEFIMRAYEKAPYKVYYPYPYP